MLNQDFINDLCNKICQDVSYKLGDMILSYPTFLRPLVIATVQACLNAQMGTMPSTDRQMYDAALAKMAVVTIPQAMDPRKGGEVTIFHKGTTQSDQCAHRLMESVPNPAWHGSDVEGDYLAYYHEERLYSVRHLKKGVCCLVYARSPHDAIEQVRNMEAKP